MPLHNVRAPNMPCHRYLLGLLTPGLACCTLPRKCRWGKLFAGIACTGMIKKAGLMNSSEDSAAVVVRGAEMNDAPALQAILNEVIADGNAFGAEEPQTLEETKQSWLAAPAAAYVACDPDGELLGAYVLKPNSLGRGAHVANATYMVARSQQGRGLGVRLGAHSLEQARRAGYRAMQFNAVVSTNTAAVALWQRLGFVRIGTVPQAFRLPNGEYVDTYIMYRSLPEERRQPVATMAIEVRELAAQDRQWVHDFLLPRDAVLVVSRGRVHQADQLPGLMALLDGAPGGLLTYHVAGDELEVVTLHADPRGHGVGTQLLAAARDLAARRHCRRLWLITTNDNEPAIRFYQQRGMHLAAVHRGAIRESRKIKPQIPLIGLNGIPIEDELEFEYRL
jgi:GNAT superfamily N-acetyltransferase